MTRVAPMLKIRNRQLLWLLPVALLLTGLLFWSSRRPQAIGPAPATTVPGPTRSAGRVRYPEGAVQLSMIKAEVLEASRVPLSEPLSARVAYDEGRTARIAVSFSGRIVSLRASPGDAVKAGQVLAEIDSPDVGSAQADLEKARADEGRKRLALERAKELAPGEAIAAKDLEAAQADQAQAHAETVRAEQRLKNLNPFGLRVQGQRLSLSSPLNGVVTERSANPAMEVAPGLAAPLFVVTDPKHLWLMVDLPETLIGKVKLGSEIEVESDAFPGERFKGRIDQLGQVVDPNTRRVVLRAGLDNPAGKLLPEMFVRAHILQDGGRGVRVPNSALIDRGVYSYVYQQIGAGEFERRQVKLVSRGSDFSYVGEGLAGGERIVTTGALLLDADAGSSGAKP